MTQNCQSPETLMYYFVLIKQKINHCFPLNRAYEMKGQNTYKITTQCDR